MAAIVIYMQHLDKAGDQMSLACNVQVMHCLCDMHTLAFRRVATTGACCCNTPRNAHTRIVLVSVQMHMRLLLACILVETCKTLSTCKLDLIGAGHIATLP